ncbi:ABC transporter ATP-binding protein [Clostridium grantii]|uniref:Putative ABC transport system ATP-binding protein n=1 Tax=Clostridium grantii DSM 8605 TaxID=1121316 RepID=A0A1M5TLS5_9CLOT|nr:ATP-binding cassette domain-containing protein [Clostridium grantii]SHH51621.1 putative ABC transport system ATP-binding protein [Clostridium grantii DSM 8605]
MIEFKNINMKFNEKQIFSDFNLKINNKEKVLLNAPSGKGKSTLFKFILGIVQPDEGQVFLNGKVIDKKNINEVREQISYVSQGIEFRNEVILQLIEEIFSFNGNKDKKLNYEKLKELMAFLNLEEEILSKEFEQLSGGEKQRIGIIIALLLDKEILLLDEATSALDKELKEKVVEFIAQSDKTIVVISHDDVWKNNNKFKLVRW